VCIKKSWHANSPISLSLDLESKEPAYIPHKLSVLSSCNEMSFVVGVDESKRKRAQDAVEDTKPSRERRRQQREEEEDRAFREKFPENGVVLITLSHVWRLHQEGEEGELASNETQMFKVPTRKLSADDLACLGRFNLNGEAVAVQDWIDLEIRLNGGIDYNVDDDDPERREERSKKWLEILGGDLSQYEWNREKGPLVTPADVVTHAFCIEC
jgi:hypothetical protein